MPGTSLLVDRCLVAAAVLLTCALFTARAADPVNVVKLVALLLCALCLTGTAVWRAARYRVVQLPVGPAAWCAAALAAAFCVSTLVAPVTTTAVVGTYGRNSGLLAYLAAVVLLLAVLRSVDSATPGLVLGGVVGAGLYTASYGVLQYAGVDAIPWNNPFNPIIAALGNPNFASGYLGIAASVGAGAAAWSRWDVRWRVFSGTTAALCLLGAALSSSVQGPIAAAAGLAVVTLTVILEWRSRFRRPALLLLAISVVTAVVILVLGAAGGGPAAAVFADVGSQARVHYWQAALAMLADHPFAGVGLDQYGNFWRTARSPASVDLLGGPSFSDAAHSVPLQMLAQGGLLLGLAYLGLVVLTGWSLARGLLRTAGPERVALGAAGAGWSAYQVQSFVSIDQVPLIVVHFVLAGLVLRLSGAARTRELRLPGAPAPAPAHRNDARTRKRVSAGPLKPRDLTPGDVGVLVATAVVLLAAAWLSLAPLRASTAVKTGDERLAQGDGNGAFQAYDRATDVLPGQAVGWTKKGNLFQQATPPQTQQALEAYEAAVQRDPYDVNAVLAAAASAETVGDLARARERFSAAARLDPLNSATLVAAATFELRHSGAERARALLEAAVLRLPEDAALWATLGDARAVLGASGPAQEAYDRALELDPAQAVAREGLTKLAKLADAAADEPK